MSMNQVKLFVFLLSLIVINGLNKKIKSHTNLQQSATGGMIYITVDNDLTSITVNGNALTLSGDVQNWTALKSIPADVHPGDTITVSGSNQGTMSDGNPAAILATIHYTDEEGKTATINTGEAWTCEGAAPKLLGANGGSTIWARNFGVIPSISSDAQWIWVNNSNESTTCSVTIPKRVITNAEINVTVDDIVDKITVNGVALTLPENSGAWNIIKSIKANIYPGDEITISGTNTGGPAGLIASISYINEDGQTATFNTGSGWTCDGKAPVLQGDAISTSTPWAGSKPFTGVNDAAQWIWNPDFPASTTCTTKIPKRVNTNAEIHLTVDDIIDKITVNGVALTLPENSGAWNIIKSIKATINPGDEVAVSGTNTGGPAGMIGTITYVNEDGNQVSLNTSSEWTCDGKAPILQGDAKNGGTPWSGAIPFANVHDEAQWIWNPDFPASTTCTIRIPSKRSTVSPVNNGSIHVTADDIIEKITVNGNALTLPEGSANWTVTKTIHTTFAPGDVIAISGRNNGAVAGGNPASIIASINYVDEHGNTAVLNTDSRWSCDEAPALVLGANSAETIWKNVKGSAMEDISPDAYWIWSAAQTETATCTFTIPKTTGKRCHRLR